MLRIMFSTDGAAFCGPDGEEDSSAKGLEVARLLEQVAEMIRDGHRMGTVLDFNGNTIGDWSLT